MNQVWKSYKIIDLIREYYKYSNDYFASIFRNTNDKRFIRGN